MKKILYLAIAFILFLNAASIQAQTTKELKNSAGKSEIIYTQPKSINNLAGHFDNKIKIIFSDIDGTLTPLDRNNPAGTVSEGLKQSIKKLNQAQIPLILVTGRSSGDAKKFVKKLGNKNVYIISFQGAEIINPAGKIIYQDNINPKDSQRILNEIELFNKFLRDADSSKKIHYHDSQFFFFVDGIAYSKTKTKFPYCCEDINIIKSLNELGPNFASGKIVLYNSDTERLKLLQAHLQKKFPNYNINRVSPYTCDITNATATKGNAIKRLTNVFSIGLKNVAVFGDSENDISMLNEARINGGLAVAVGNAMDLVKDNANFVTSPVYEDGFAKAVDKILENNAGLK